MGTVVIGVATGAIAAETVGETGVAETEGALEIAEALVVGTAAASEDMVAGLEGTEAMVGMGDQDLAGQDLVGHRGVLIPPICFAAWMKTTME